MGRRWEKEDGKIPGKMRDSGNEVAFLRIVKKKCQHRKKNYNQQIFLATRYIYIFHPSNKPAAISFALSMNKMMQGAANENTAGIHVGSVKELISQKSEVLFAVYRLP